MLQRCSTLILTRIGFYKPANQDPSAKFLIKVKCLQLQWVRVMEVEFNRAFFDTLLNVTNIVFGVRTIRQSERGENPVKLPTLRQSQLGILNTASDVPGELNHYFDDLKKIVCSKSVYYKMANQTGYKSSNSCQKEHLSSSYCHTC